MCCIIILFNQFPFNVFKLCLFSLNVNSYENVFRNVFINVCNCVFLEFQNQSIFYNIWFFVLNKTTMRLVITTLLHGYYKFS